MESRKRAKRADKNTIIIDPAKLRAALAKHSSDNGKLSYDEMARKCGFTGSWLDNFLAYGKMPFYATILLENALNIPLSDYEKVAEPETEIEPEIVNVSMKFDDLYKLIYAASYEAIKQVLKEQEG